MADTERVEGVVAIELQGGEVLYFGENDPQVELELETEEQHERHYHVNGSFYAQIALRDVKAILTRGSDG